MTILPDRLYYSLRLFERQASPDRGVSDQIEIDPMRGVSCGFGNGLRGSKGHVSRLYRSGGDILKMQSSKNTPRLHIQFTFTRASRRCYRPVNDVIYPLRPVKRQQGNHGRNGVGSIEFRTTTPRYGNLPFFGVLLTCFLTTAESSLGVFDKLRIGSATVGPTTETAKCSEAVTHGGPSSNAVGHDVLPFVVGVLNPKGTTLFQQVLIQGLFECRQIGVLVHMFLQEVQREPCPWAFG